MSKITINGKSYVGDSIVINNDKIIIDGKNLSDHDQEKEINISVEGDINALDVDVCQRIEVKGNGNVGYIKSVSGTVFCNNITGDAETTSGNINCEDVGGNVKTVSGDIHAHAISGKVNTVSGDINGSVNNWEMKKLIVQECIDALLKQMYPMIHENSYPSDAVPKATILSLHALVN